MQHFTETETLFFVTDSPKLLVSDAFERTAGCYHAAGDAGEAAQNHATTHRSATYVHETRVSGDHAGIRIETVDTVKFTPQEGRA